MIPVGVVLSGGEETPSLAAAAPAALAAKHPGGYIASGGFFLPSLSISQHSKLGKKKGGGTKKKTTKTPHHSASQAGGIAASHRHTVRERPAPSLCTSLVVQIFPPHIHTSALRFDFLAQGFVLRNPPQKFCKKIAKIFN